MNPLDSFIALDLETTGLDHKKEDIIEIGLVLFKEGKIIDTFSQTVNPGKEVSENVLILTGISQEELYKSPTIDKLIPAVKDFIKELPLVGHNISFDISFLEKHLSLSNPSYDTLNLSRIYLHFSSSHKLSYLADYLGIPYKEAHRAKMDAEISGWIFLRLFEIMNNVHPEILKQQLNVLEPKYQEADIIKEALEISCKKGLNRTSYPFEIPVNFREEKKEESKEDIEGNTISISDLFKREELEDRPSQIEMAKMVQSAMNNDEFLLVEASAGTGKSLAYLVPSILFTISNKEQIYISSYTKNLQQQLFNNDIPKAEEITGIRINTVLAKGKSNYLCLLKFKGLFSDMDPISLSALYLWSSLTRTGDLSEVSYLFRQINIGLLNMDESCKKQNCPFYNDCFYYRMKKRMKKADLILINHPLFFTGNLPAERVIFDEAHEIERAATDGFSLSVSFREIQATLKNISRELKGKTKKEIDKLLNSAKKTFKTIGKSFTELNDYGVGFYRDIQLSPLRTLSENLNNFLEIISSYDFEQEKVVNRLKEIIKNLDILIQQEKEDRVFYAELPIRNKPSSLQLIGAPLDIGTILEEYLYPRLSSSIMTSATLTVGESFDFIKHILGLNRYTERLREVSLPDTYNFKEQALTIIPRYLPSPHESGYIEGVGRFILDIILPLNKGTLVLFTSYKHIKGVYQQIKAAFSNKGRELLIQGFGKSPDKLLSLFKENKGSVLLGTGSFWQGVDIPGKALEIVVIEKLPFANPSDPFISAKSAYFEDQGLGGFSSYILPLSVLRFKQGFGRLIRSTHDMGVVFILDNRIVNKWYGSAFRDSLPTSISVVDSSLEVKEAVRLWFEEGRIYTTDYWEG